MTTAEQLERLNQEATRIAVASRKAIESAIRLHEGFQQPMAIWSDGQPVWATPEEARSQLLPAPSLTTEN